MAEKSKGIRVNALAKELGVESKAILAKLRDEGLGEAAPNHMTVLKLGLVASVREWFSGGGVATAVETAPPVKAVKKRPPAPRPSISEHAGEDDNGDAHVPAGESPAEAVAEAPTPDAPQGEPAVEATAPAAEVPAPTQVEASTPEVPQATSSEDGGGTAPVADAPAGESHATSMPSAPAPELQPEVAAPASQSTAPIQQPLAPAAAAPTPVAPHRHPAPPAAPPVQRPTVTLGSSRLASPANIERRPVTVAPQLTPTMLAPAAMQGPRVIRVEKADNVPTPRPRGPMGRPGQEGTGPAAFTTARPATGRGVRVFVDEEEEEAKKKAAAKAKTAGGLSGRRRGVDGRRGEAMEKLKDFSEADLAERRIRLGDAGKHRAAFDSHLSKIQQRGQGFRAQTGAQRGEPIEIEEPITVKSLSSVLGIKGNDLVRKLFMSGVRDININSTLDADTAGTLALEYGVELMIAVDETMFDQLASEFTSYEHKPENMALRPAVVTILGHVDHGKTSLLDKIRSANVAAGEAGGITQHTAAWVVEVGEGENKKKVTFIDTPGHQAFTSMRARGAQVTDVVVLVVAAVEGVMPQTIESINHAKAAGVPIVVAMNKIDRPDANPDMVLGQLAANGLNPVEWGGDTEVIRTSAVTGQGIPNLIEVLDLQAQIMDLKADPTAPARGSVIEAQMNVGLGPVATVLVQDGTLRVGDIIVSGPGYGRIRSLLNDRGEMIQEAGPSTPVVVSGLDELPGAGDKFYVTDDAERARAIAEEAATMDRQTVLSSRTQVSLSNLMSTIKEGSIKTINLILKGDMQGSIETLAKTVTDQNTDEVRVKVIHSAVGGITESDVELADASGAVIIGFHVVPDEAARAMAEQRKVEVRLYSVIYEIFDDLKKALSGMLTPETREKLHGHVEVRQVFKVSKLGNIAGCFVTDGHIQRGSRIRLSRGGIVVVEDLAIETLRRLKDDVKEVKAGLECGIKLANYDDVKIGDVFEAYIRETFQRTL